MSLTTEPNSLIKLDLTGNALEFLNLCEQANSFFLDHLTIHQLILGGNELTCLKNFSTLFSFLENSLTELSLRNNHLNQFPLDVLVLKNLTSLSLCNNGLQCIPVGTLSQLTGLLWLNLGKNELSDLPADIANCTKLKGLDLHSNKFTEFPRPVYFLTELQVLAAQDNQIEYISDEFGQLQKLDTLNLCNNQLIQIPTSLVHNPPLNLSHLYLGKNPIRTLHSSFLFVGYQNLASLDLFSCDLEYLSAEFFQYLSKSQVFQRLNLAINKLTKLPMEIGLLTNLKWLNLNENPLKELPHTMSQLTKLVKLGLVKNQIETLPPYLFSRMFDLEKLDLRENHLRYLPFSILALVEFMERQFFHKTYQHILHPCCANFNYVCNRQPKLTVFGVPGIKMQYVEGVIYNDGNIKDLLALASAVVTRQKSSTATECMAHFLSNSRIGIQKEPLITKKFKQIHSLKESCIRSLLNHKQKSNKSCSYIDRQDKLLEQALPSNFVPSLLRQDVVSNASFCDLCCSWYTQSRFQFSYCATSKISVRANVCSAKCAFEIMVQVQELHRARLMPDPEAQDPGAVSRAGDVVIPPMPTVAEISRPIGRDDSSATREVKDAGPSPPEVVTLRYHLVNGELVESYSRVVFVLTDPVPSLTGFSFQAINAIRLARF